LRWRGGGRTRTPLSLRALLRAASEGIIRARPLVGHHVGWQRRGWPDTWHVTPDTRFLTPVFREQVRKLRRLGVLEQRAAEKSERIKDRIADLLSGGARLYEAEELIVPDYYYPPEE